MVTVDGSSGTSHESFVITMSHALKGSLEEKSALLICMICGAQSNKPSLAQIKQVINFVLSSAKLKSVYNSLVIGPRGLGCESNL